MPTDPTLDDAIKAGDWTLVRNIISYNVPSGKRVTNAQAEALAKIISIAERAGAMEAEVRQLRAQLEAAQGALKAMVRSHGMHGPCKANGCADCRRAHSQARAALTTPASAEPTLRRRSRRYFVASADQDEQGGVMPETKYSQQRRRRIEAVARALRPLGVADDIGLAEYVLANESPSVEALSQFIRRAAIRLPPSFSHRVVAEMIVAALQRVAAASADDSPVELSPWEMGCKRKKKGKGGTGY
jgi:hypothetical protein